MGKKIHARDLREQRKTDRTEKFADQNKKREAERAVQKKDAAVSVKSVSSFSRDSISCLVEDLQKYARIKPIKEPMAASVKNTLNPFFNSGVSFLMR